MRRATGLLFTLLLALALLCATVPALALVGQFKDTPIQAADMEGRRAPEGMGCQWKTEGLVIGLGEKAEFRVREAEDPDWYLDPWTVWDPVEARWEFEKDGQPAYPSGNRDLADRVSGAGRRSDQIQV